MSKLNAIAAADRLADCQRRQHAAPWSSQQPIANLHAVAVDRDFLARRDYREERDPPGN
jgi:hypothetical protein